MILISKTKMSKIVIIINSPEFFLVPDYEIEYRAQIINSFIAKLDTVKEIHKNHFKKSFVELEKF